MISEKTTVYDQVVRWCKNQPVIVGILILFALVGGLGAFTGALDSIFSIYSQYRESPGRLSSPTPEAKKLRVNQTPRFDPSSVPPTPEEILRAQPPSAGPKEVRHDLADLAEDLAGISNSGYDFRLIECLRHESVITCYFAIRNIRATEREPAADRLLELYSAKAIDSNGIDHEAVAIQLGRNRRSTPDYMSVSNYMPQGVFIKAAVQFDGVSDGASGLDYLKLAGRGEYLREGSFGSVATGARESVEVIFRDIPIGAHNTNDRTHTDG